jgi:formylglycine-generating enzyme required for sulfatase activity
MVGIPGGSFRMGSDKHYPEEAPSHRVTVGGFWIDRTPVTNPQFKDQDSPQGSQRRLASMRAELLPPLPPGRAPCGSGGYVNEPRRISMCQKAGSEKCPMEVTERSRN